MPKTPYRGEAEVKDQVPPDVATAFRMWGRSVLGAPRRLDTQITSVVERDETITRLATKVIRRDLAEERAPAPRRTRKVAVLVDPATIDPFAESLGALRDRTEHTERCAGCGGSGTVACPACSGSGRQRCGSCNGSGQVLRHYKKTSKFVRCTVCHAQGTVGCGGCGARGNVTCQSCGGSGEQLVWWAYREHVRVVLGFDQDSPIVAAHRYLQHARFLAPADLGAFTPLLTLETSGPMSSDSLSPEDASLLARLSPPLNQQLERVVSQQFLRFGVVRRDVRYEMCGAGATVVLSGANLVGATTGAAVGPIRRRTIAWGAVGLLLAVLTAWYRGLLAGPTAYFDGVNRAVTVVLLIGSLAALVAAGGALRVLRPGLRFWRLSTIDQVAAGTFAVAVLLSPLIAYFSRPTAQEMRAAIASGDLDRAKLVVDALTAGHSGTQESDLVDELRLAVAERLPLDERLSELDAVAARSGAFAKEASERARAARLEAIRAVLEADRPAEALSLLERWATALADGEEVDELRAQAFDKQAASCSDEMCRLSATRSARNARATPERREAEERARLVLLDALAIGKPPKLDSLDRARALRALAERAAATQSIAGDDVDLSESARSALSWATAERAKMALLGASAALVNELLNRPDGATAAVGWSDLEGVAVYASMADGQCKGLYVVGAKVEARALSGHEGGLQHLLAQATGQPQAMLRSRPPSPRTHEVSKWMEGGTPVLARWNGDTLMELRIGDASP